MRYIFHSFNKDETFVADENASIQAYVDNPIALSQLHIFHSGRLISSDRRLNVDQHQYRLWSNTIVSRHFPLPLSKNLLVYFNVSMIVHFDMVELIVGLSVGVEDDLFYSAFTDGEVEGVISLTTAPFPNLE